VFDNAGKPHAYEALTPDVVLDALSDLGLEVDGRLTALSSYENRVYQAMLDDNSSVVAKFYRPERWSDAQILEEHRFAVELMAEEVPLVGPLNLHGNTLHHAHGFAFSVSPRRGGRMPELDDAEVLEWVGRFIARIHNVGAQQKFKSRPTLDVNSFAIDSRDWLIEQRIIPMDQQSEWLAVCNQAIDIAQEKFAAHPSQQIRLHGDCHPGNILWTPTELPNGGPHFVDLDDARTGPAIQDLWMLLGERQERSAQLATLLAGYEDFFEFNPRELHLIEALRTLRLLHYSAWLARRWDDPAFPAAFPWFNTVRYWQDRILELREQIALMDEPPLWPL